MKQVSFWDIVRFAICLMIACPLYIAISIYGTAVSNKMEPAIITLVWGLFLSESLPVFCSIFIGLSVISWRFKIIAGTLLLFGAVALKLYGLIICLADLRALLYSVMQVSFCLGGSILAISLWINMGDKRKRRVSVSSEKLGVSLEAEPRTSMMLVGLSIVSVFVTYIAIFVSAFVTVGFTIPLVLFLIQMPRSFMQILAMTLAIPVVAIWDSIRALWTMFFSKPPFQPAIILNIKDMPLLNAAIDDICKKVNTDKPVAVILHAEPTFFVMQGALNTYEGVVNGRILALGAPLLKELNTVEIKSILAHEFAHFSGRDTIYSTLVTPAYRGISMSLEKISQGVVTEMGFLLLSSHAFLKLFFRYFTTIDMIISRSREARADWIAANLYGKKIFVDALSKVIAVSRHFAEHGAKFVEKCGDDLFDAHSKELRCFNDRLSAYRETAMQEAGSEFDSHPTLTQRINYLPDIKGSENDNQSAEINSELTVKEKELSLRITGQYKEIKKLQEGYVEMIDKAKNDAEKLRQEKVAALASDKPFYCPNCYRTYNIFISNMCKKCDAVLVANPNYIAKKK